MSGIAPDELLNDLQELEEQKLIPACLATCRFALRRLPRSDWGNRYRFGVSLVKYLMNHMPQPLSSREYDEAIRVLKNLQKSAPQGERGKTARCHLFLGLLFQNRKKGEKLANLKEALRHYTRARPGLRQAGDQEAWAAATAALAEIHVALDRGVRNMNRAIRLTKAALSVYTAADFPKDHRIYSCALLALEKRKFQEQQRP